MRFHNAFSLAEILIVLGIIGICVAFTIPKFIGTQNDSSSKNSAVAVHTAYMVLTAFENYRLINGSIPSSVTLSAFIPYMNYVKNETGSNIPLDDRVGANFAYNCNLAYMVCLRLHSGGMLYWRTDSFNLTVNPTTKLFGIYFMYDPDAIRGTSGTADGPSKPVGFILYYDGYIREYGSTFPNTIVGSGSDDWSFLNPQPTWTPSWFKGL